MRSIRLSHTALECPRERYSVSREAPEEENEGNDRRRKQATQGPAVPSSSFSSRVGPSETCERGTDQVTHYLPKCLSGLKVNLKYEDLPLSR